MRALQFPTLPASWWRLIHRRPATGCWRWDVSVSLRWPVARQLIAAHVAGHPVGPCAVTAGCVHPLHGPDTTRPTGGAS